MNIPVFSQKTYKTLKKIFYSINNNYNNQQINDIIINKKKINTMSHPFNNTDNSYICSKIKKTIINKYIYQYNVNYEFVSLSLFYNNDKSIKKVKKYMIKLLKKILTVVSFTKINNINIYLCPTKYKKQLPKYPEIIGISHVNSGVAFMNTNQIYIWRDEELEKVLIHELIHVAKYDYNIYSNNIFSSIFCISDKRLAIHESYTEILTLFFNIALFDNVDYIIFIQMLRLEIIHSLVQTAKILKYYKYKSFRQLLKSSSNNCEILFNQKTHIISYYIIKSALIYHLNWLLNLNSSDIIFNYQKLDNLLKLMTKCLYNKKYIIVIDKLIKKGYTSDSLRMTGYNYALS